MAQAVGHTMAHQSGQLLPCRAGVGQRPGSCRAQRSLLGTGHRPCTGALYKEHLSQVHASRNWGQGAQEEARRGEVAAVCMTGG